MVEIEGDGTHQRLRRMLHGKGRSSAQAGRRTESGGGGPILRNAAEMYVAHRIVG